MTISDREPYFQATMGILTKSIEANRHLYEQGNYGYLTGLITLEITLGLALVPIGIVLDTISFPGIWIYNHLPQNK